MNIARYIPRIPAITVPLTCNFCLQTFWPQPAFYPRHLQRVVRALHPMVTMMASYVCVKCAEDKVWED